VSAPPDPSYDDVRILPAGDVPRFGANDMDGNGHLTVHDHVRIAAHGAHAVLAAAGMTEQRRARTGATVFTAEHHVRYRHELRTGTSARVHTRLIGLSDRAVHLVGYLVDVEAGRIATVLEALVVSVDLARRRVTPFPEDVHAALGRTHAEHGALGWLPRLSGAIGVR
jgi:acyl-CoA thioester hydrolase